MQKLSVFPIFAAVKRRLFYIKVKYVNGKTSSMNFLYEQKKPLWLTQRFWILWLKTVVLTNK